MYLEEMKEQELNGSEEKSSNSGEDLATMFSGKNGVSLQDLMLSN